MDRAIAMLKKSNRNLHKKFGKQDSKNDIVGIKF